MKSIIRRASTATLFVSIFSVLLSWAEPASSQNITWQAIPFPVDSDWGGSHGQPATISANQVVLDGQSVRSLETFSGPTTLSFDVTENNDATQQGGFFFSIIPPTDAINSNLISGMELSIAYGNLYANDLQLLQYPSNNLWSNAFNFATGVTYHWRVSVAASGALGFSVDGQTYSLPNTASLSSSQFQFQMQGWQPNDFWTVSNFAVVPEPTTVTLLGVSLASLTIVLRRRKTGINS